MAASRSRYVVHERAMDRLTLPGGQVFRYTRALTKEIEREAKGTAPVRTGRLRESIKADLRGSNTRDATNFRVVVGAEHGMYVVHITRPVGLVFEDTALGRRAAGSAKGVDMRLYGRVPGSWMNTKYAGYQGARVQGRKGYAANTFLEDALHTVLTAHGLI